MTYNRNRNQKQKGEFPMAFKYYTIKQLSDELHVTKPGIRKLMTNSFRKRYTSVTGNRILINEAGAKIIREHFENSKSETNQKPKTETINSNQKQSETVSDSPSNAVLSAKDETITLLKEQLKAKDDQIANMQKLMDQNQQLLLNTQSENKHLLALTHDESKKNSNVQEAEYKETDASKEAEKETTENSENADNTDDNRPWWKRIF